MLSRAAAREMKKTGGGYVVNIASTRALMSEINSEAYAGSIPEITSNFGI